MWFQKTIEVETPSTVGSVFIIAKNFLYILVEQWKNDVWNDGKKLECGTMGMWNYQYRRYSLYGQWICGSFSTYLGIYDIYLIGEAFGMLSEGTPPEFIMVLGFNLLNFIFN